MPYKSVYSTKSITAQTVSVTIDLPPPPWTAGQTFTIYAVVRKDTGYWAGTTVGFYLVHAGATFLLGEKTTDPSGMAGFGYTIPWTIDTHTLPCSSISFYAQEKSTGTKSATVSGSVAYPTRISISAPDSVAPGQSFTVSGKLEYQSSSAAWSGLAGRTVSIYYDGTKAADVTTASDGTYSKAVSIPTPGTYTLKAQFAGEGLAAISIMGITVGIPEGVGFVPYTLAALPILLVGTVIAYSEVAKVKR